MQAGFSSGASYFVNIIHEYLNDEYDEQTVK